MSSVSFLKRSKDEASQFNSSDLVEAAKSLYKHLHFGFGGTGLHRVPIAGDTTKLPYASGLSPLEKKLAWTQHFLAAQLPGSQQLRRGMGHRQFGARVVYGDCMFFTVSPNEHHSALVLRLSRFRKSDPYIVNRIYIFCSYDGKHQQSINVNSSKHSILELMSRRFLCVCSTANAT